MMIAELASDRRADNLDAFARYMPELHKLLRNHVPQSRLVDNPDGSHDIEFRRQCLYDVAGDGTTGPELARKMAEALRDSGRRRLYVSPLDSKNLDKTSEGFVANLLKEGVNDGVQFLEAPKDNGAYHLIALGMGLGYHLAEAIALAEPFSICIVEPNIDFLYHSLATFDWRTLLERRAAWPQSVSILGADRADELAREMRTHCRHSNPAALDSTLIIQSYANDTMEAAASIFGRDAHLVHSGLGFIQDEMEMVRASHGNLVKHDDFRLFRRNTVPAELPAFIVGSGPSIDDDLEFIKANQDRAVIFSCGSALGVLLANGIRPDFQMQLENGEAPREMLEAMAKRYDYTGIRLIGSNTISPQTRPLFAERVFFMRQSLASYAMFSPGHEYSLDRSGPTVTNTGLEAAMQSGFREFYLFGCDLGARTPERHHSRFSPYHMNERAADYDAAVVFAQSLPMRDIGNFGGVVFTNDIMVWSRDAMEQSIATMRPGSRVLNCSDGLRIKGARPQVSAGIKLTAPAGRKQQVLDRLVANWPEAKTFEFAKRWQSVDWRGRVRNFAESLIEVCEEAPERTQELLHRLGPILIPDHKRMPTFEEYYLRGTFFVSMIAADYYARRVHPPEKRTEFRARTYAALADLLRTMIGQTDWFFEHIDELATLNDLKEGLRSWTEKATQSPRA